MHARARAPREEGFSLVELLVVISIIGILATMVTVKVIGAMGEARITRAKAEISEIKKAIGIYSIYNNGRIPDGLDELSQDQKKTGEPIIEIGDDPWGRPYEYEKLGSRKFVIRSLGGDGSPGGEGEDADIDSDHLQESSKEAAGE